MSLLSRTVNAKGVLVSTSLSRKVILNCIPTRARESPTWSMNDIVDRLMALGGGLIVLTLVLKWWFG
jgi:hypothetical protein